jgi:hypothetical protein
MVKESLQKNFQEAVLPVGCFYQKLFTEIGAALSIFGLSVEAPPE